MKRVFASLPIIIQQCQYRAVLHTPESYNDLLVLSQKGKIEGEEYEKPKPRPFIGGGKMNLLRGPVIKGWAGETHLRATRTLLLWMKALHVFRLIFINHSLTIVII